MQRLAIFALLQLFLHCAIVKCGENDKADPAAAAEQALRTALHSASDPAIAKKVAIIRLQRALRSAATAGTAVSEVLLEQARETLSKAETSKENQEKLMNVATAENVVSKTGRSKEAMNAAKTSKSAGKSGSKKHDETQRERKRRRVWSRLEQLVAEEPKNTTLLAEALMAAKLQAQEDAELIRLISEQLASADRGSQAKQLNIASSAYGARVCSSSKGAAEAAAIVDKLCQQLSEEEWAKVSARIGENNCAHDSLRSGAGTPPQANALPSDTSKHFCKYPPPFDLAATEDGEGYMPVQFQFPRAVLEAPGGLSTALSEIAVVNLDMATFRSHIAPCAGQELWLLEFYVHWCPHCMRVMPKLYRLGVALRASGAKLKIGAVNCATQRDLCGAFQVMGHPMVAFFYASLGESRSVQLFDYRGRDVRVNAVLNGLKQQSRSSVFAASAPTGMEPPEHLFPAEAAIDLVAMLPEDYRPNDATLRWLRNSSISGIGTPCPPVRPWYQEATDNGEDPLATTAKQVKRFPGNGWPVQEHIPRHLQRQQDAAQAITYTLEEWVRPSPGPNSSSFFAYSELQDLEAWAALLSQSFPAEADESSSNRSAFSDALEAMHTALREKVKEVEEAEGSAALCMDEWQPLVARVRQAFEAGWVDSSTVLPSGCRTETCRVWSLLHIMSLSPLVVAEASLKLKRNDAIFDAMIAFLRRYFTCTSCRTHFLRQVEEKAYALSQARVGGPIDLALWWWRLHSAVSIRVAQESATCKADRRWPPADACPSCWAKDNFTSKLPLAGANEAAILEELLRQYHGTAPVGE